MSEFITKSSCDVKIKSMDYELLCKISVRSLINCLNLHWEVKDSSFFAFITFFIIRAPIFWPFIKLPKVMPTNRFQFAILSCNKSKFVKNVFQWSYDWLAESRYYYTVSHLHSDWNLNIAWNNTAWKVSVIGVILVRIFQHLDWIRRDTEYLFIFSPNVGKYGPE